MIVIGLVGRIGAGKSTVARRFAEHGATVVDADRQAHEALADPEVVAEVARRFGPGVLDGRGGVDRSALAGEVFGGTADHDAARAALEAIVHPRVRRRLQRVLAAAAAEGPAPAGGRAVVLDVPLLVQAGWTDLCTDLVVIECEDQVRRARLTARGWSPDQIAARDRAWERGFLPPPPGPATWRVDASRDPAYTLSQVDRIWQAIRGR
jgi:dephospho-CoA kinase